jgi:hypothetical protein
MATNAGGLIAMLWPICTGLAIVAVGLLSLICGLMLPPSPICPRRRHPDAAVRECVQRIANEW